MAKLEDLEGELYREEGKEELEKRRQKKFFLSLPSTRLPHAWSGDGSKESYPRMAIMRGRAAKILLGIFLTLAVTAGALFLFLYFGSRPQEVSLRIEAREEIESGETLTISIPYKNISRAPLREVELTIILPPGTRIKEGGTEYEAPLRIPKSISDLAPGEERLEELTVRMFGREKEEGRVDVELGYRPENVGARFTADASKMFRIVRVPLGITWEIPDTLAQGQDVDLLVRYSSNSRDTFSDLALRLDFPPGFTFKEASPKQSDTGIWNIGNLRAGGSGVVTIRGTVTGDEGEIKTFRGGIGVYHYDSKSWTPYYDSFYETKIAVTPLFVRGQLERSQETAVNPGDQLRFTIHYQNNTLFPLKDVSVRTQIDGAILELKTMTIGQGGVFDFPTRSIVWGPANFEGLREVPPGGAGDLSFSLFTKETPIVKSTADRELVIRLTSHIEASGIPQDLIGTDLTHDDSAEFKVNSKVIFDGKALYTSSALKNSGPVPPRVGQKTTYAVLWEIRNFTNDLKNAEVTATLPPNVKWEGVFVPTDAQISYNESSGEIRWKIGTIRSGRGVLEPALTAAFRVAVIPSEVDLGNVITLVNHSTLSAEDGFTGSAIEKTLPAFTTYIPDDPVYGESGRVLP